MKALRLITGGILMSALIFSCKQYYNEDLSEFQGNSLVDEPAFGSVTGKASNQGGPCNPNAYDVVLESRTLVDGNWEWVWSVSNPNPGNGSNGTAKDLSHWGMRMGICVTPSTIISAAYSGDGLVWTDFEPGIKSEPSQDCLTTPVLKFDYGTTGTAKSYYRLVINQEFSVGNAFGYWKGGQGCCTFNFTGIDCASGPVEIVE